MILNSLLIISLIIVSVMAIRWRSYINGLNKVIEEQQELINSLSPPRVAMEEADDAKITPASIQLPDSIKTGALPVGNDVQHGINAFMRGNYPKAADIIPQFAEQEHVKAQTILAKMYFSGNGVPRDMQKYAYWLQRAADNGHKPSKAKLKKLNRRQ